MRILSISAQKPYETGSGFHLIELVRAWNKIGHSQCVIAGITKEDNVVLPDGVDFRPVYYETDSLPFPVCGMSDEMPYHSTRYSDMIPEMVSCFKNAFLSAVSEAIASFRPDLIICHHIYLLTSFIVQAFPEMKICAICHGTDIRQLKKNPLERDFIISSIPGLHKIIAESNYLRSEIGRMFDLDTDGIPVIGSGYNEEIFHRMQTEKHDEIRLLYAGKLSNAKGVPNLVRALNRLSYPSDKMVLTLAGGAGSDKSINEIKDLVLKSRYRIELAGKIPQMDLAKLMNECDTFILPSFYESSPLVIAEAMACGAKIVCNDLPGIKSFYDKIVPDNDIVFVELPRMKNTDEPLEEDIDSYEQRLADAISESVAKPASFHAGIENLTWKGIAGAILSACS